MSLVVRDGIYSGIDLQFPTLYQEEGEFMVEFTKAYYKFLDERMNRNVPKLRDIDTTLASFLIFFKKKYLADLPLDTVIDTRFIIKHVSDLYKRKGTQESLELLFQLFYNEQIEVFYPSTNILRASDSVWGGDSYLEMKPVFVVEDYSIQKGDRIRGDISLASAFVDEILFVNFTGSLTPIVYLSNAVGKFSSDDGLTVSRSGIITSVGRLIAGSISLAVVEDSNRISNQAIGDRLKLVSNNYGIDATASVLAVSDASSGQIDFAVQEGGFGYVNSLSATASNNVGISNQVLIVSQALSLTINIGDVITCTNAAISAPGKTFAATPSPINGSGVVIAYTHPLLFIKTTTASKFNLFPANPLDTSQQRITNMVATFTITRVVDEVLANVGTSTLSSIGPYNDSASYQVSDIINNEYVTLITDQIEDYKNVTLNSTDYNISRVGQQTLNTTLKDAFTPITVEIGTILNLKVLSSGTDYQNDVFSSINHINISKFNKRDVIINFSNPAFLLKVGDTVTQVRQIEDLAAVSQVGNIDVSTLAISNNSGNYPSATTITVTSGNTVPYTVKAKFIRRDGDDYYFRQLSFYDFDETISVNINNNLYSIQAVRYDTESLPMGANAVITGKAKYGTGQIEKIAIISSGYRYQDNETVDIVNQEPTSLSYNKKVATAVLRATGAGATEGKWKTTTSFLSETSKKIQDNNYYQEYSYEISSIIDPAKYEPLIKDTIGVAGTKIFSSPLINSISEVSPSIDIEIQVYNITEEPLMTEDTSAEPIVTENDENIVIVVVSLDLDSALSSSITASIGT